MSCPVVYVMFCDVYVCHVLLCMSCSVMCMFCDVYVCHVLLCMSCSVMCMYVMSCCVCHVL